MTQMTQIESEHDTDSEKSVTYYVYYTKLTIEKAFANKRASSSVRTSVSKQASVANKQDRDLELIQSQCEHADFL